MLFIALPAPRIESVTIKSVALSVLKLFICVTQLPIYKLRSYAVESCFFLTAENTFLTAEFRKGKRRVPQRYVLNLCGTLRGTLRNFAVHFYDAEIP